MARSMKQDGKGHYQILIVGGKTGRVRKRAFVRPNSPLDKPILEIIFRNLEVMPIPANLLHPSPCRLIAE